MDSLDYRLLNEFQRGFPLVSQPYRTLALDCGVSEAHILDRLAALRAGGFIGRIGAVVAPGRIGASTLAALRVPSPRLDGVAAIVSACPEVNHNYAREHVFNLWFVASAQNEDALARLLERIRRATRYTPISLPLIAEYRIDLGFDLGGRSKGLPTITHGASPSLCSGELRLLCALQEGLELVSEPYLALARRADISEAMVLRCLDRWLGDGTIRRIGIIVRHHELGYCANAMAVWDVPDDAVDVIGRQLAQEAQVTLAYRRQRCLPLWPYNLFCMIHGKQRDQVATRVSDIARSQGLSGYPSAVLFSSRRYKQTGARYVRPEVLSAHG